MCVDIVDVTYDDALVLCLDRVHRCFCFCFTHWAKQGIALVDQGCYAEGCYGEDVFGCLTCIVFQNGVFALLSDAKAHKG